jgi:GMP synthase (glutamine-hydrolysing)
MQKGSMWGVQFHPEVSHTPHGKAILANFLRFAACEQDWQPSSVVASIQEDVAQQVGNERVIFGFSGGVDSTTVSAILAPVLGDRLHAVTIDGGQLRQGELDEIRVHANAAGVDLRVIDGRDVFQEVLNNYLCRLDYRSLFGKLFARVVNVLAKRVFGYRGVTDAEEKRRRFKLVYSLLLVRAANEVGARKMLQGTLAPDRIESGTTGGAVIKSHHNVGLNMGALAQLHPIGHLFKYEVRALAKEIGLPESVWNRQPFPGPGLFLRVVGVPATPDKLKIVRWADARAREILTGRGIYDELSQLIVAYLGVNTVGVKGDARVYRGSIVVRAVETIDFMTAEGVWFPKAVADEIKRMLSAHPEIVRVWFDPTDKPPATTEME